MINITYITNIQDIIDILNITQSSSVLVQATTEKK